MSPAPVLKAALDSGICSPKRPPGSHPQALSLLASPSRGSKLQSQYLRLGYHIYTWQTGHLHERVLPFTRHAVSPSLAVVWPVFPASEQF